MLSFCRYGLALVIASAGLSACQTMKVDELPANADPSAEINKTDADLHAAADRQLDVTSPSYFSAAKDALSDAKKARDEGKDNEKVLHYVAMARANLKKVDNVANIEQASLADTLKARQAAVAAEAPKFDGDKFKALDNELRDVGAKVEDNDLSKAEKEHARLAGEYAKLEVDAIKQGQLRSARGNIDQAIKEGAKEDAPQTLDAARHSEIEAEHFIEGNPHDTAGITQRVAQANTDAQHLLDVTRQVKVTAKTRPEAVVLQEEAAKHQLTQQEQELAAKQAALAAQEGRVNSLSQSNSQLEQKGQAERDFEQKFAAAKAAFSPAEAVVLRDGNRLVLRLKALTFPSGKQVIPTEDYALLGKVQKVMKDFGAQAVDIQGHTDSVGGKKKNQTLSEQRAKAVEDYLVANGAVDRSKVTAEGFGDTKPIASNRDKDGRAENRRIDLILTPGLEAAH